MGYSVKILADSVNRSGDRLTTFELSYPRFVHAELMTHRLFSRNAASSRAIPVERMIEKVLNDPVEPKWWGKNQRGMQAKQELQGTPLARAQARWMVARNDAVNNARRLHNIGAHKQLVNRLLEPWMFITVIVSATEYENWYYLRDSEFAQPEIAWVAAEMRKVHQKSEPEFQPTGGWHTPLVSRDPSSKLYVAPEEIIGIGLSGIGRRVMAKCLAPYRACISAARCARVSYLTHDGKRDLEKDLELFLKLSGNGHWSPFEHTAVAIGPYRRGNFMGWKQLRKFFADEHAGRCLE